jgi:hypothetical protein
MAMGDASGKVAGDLNDDGGAGDFSCKKNENSV